jgi:nucleotide-binding universal stress UspA family protein
MSLPDVPCILVALDLEEDSDHVVSAATELALRLGARVLLLHVQDRGLDQDREAAARHIAEEDAREHGDMLLIAESLRAQELEVETFVLEGAAIEVILDMTRKHEATYLVIGVHQRGMLYELLVGSVSRSLLESSPCPVLAVPPPSGQGSSTGS